MSYSLYPRLAVSGIRKNARLYVPYFLTCAGAAAMLYVISFFSYHPEYYDIGSGRESIRYVMQLGGFVIAVFAAIFLFYTNSFLIRRRKREFGLYSVLGMGRREIFRVLEWETAITAALTIVCGVALGVLFARLAAFALAGLIGKALSVTLPLDGRAVVFCTEVFAAIFALLLLSSCRQIRRSTALSLLGSESCGEKPPRSRLLLTIPGVALLGTAYYLAVSITDPVEALLLFFVAVIMVIAATYLLFAAGSVTVCRALQKNEKFYYQKRNFVFVSSLCYRMKRSGAGLASICILSTMVLVTLGSSAALYFGVEDMLSSHALRLGLTASELAAARTEYYALYGCLFFLGILLSILFLAASALTLYYKQLSEGYEDAARFAVMRRVGMTERDIRESVGAQMRLLFFAPLGAAAVHLAFAVPMLWKILQCFQLENLTLVLAVMTLAVAAYAILYYICYRLSSNAYVKLVTAAA